MARMGNVLGKTRVNVFLSYMGRLMIQRLVEELGLSQTGVIEQAVRKLYKAELGNWDPRKQRRPSNWAQDQGLGLERDETE